MDGLQDKNLSAQIESVLGGGRGYAAHLTSASSHHVQTNSPIASSKTKKRTKKEDGVSLERWEVEARTCAYGSINGAGVLNQIDMPKYVRPSAAKAENTKKTEESNLLSGEEGWEKLAFKNKMGKGGSKVLSSWRRGSTYGAEAELNSSFMSDMGSSQGRGDPPVENPRYESWHLLGKGFESNAKLRMRMTPFVLPDADDGSDQLYFFGGIEGASSSETLGKDGRSKDARSNIVSRCVMNDDGTVKSWEKVPTSGWPLPKPRAGHSATMTESKELGKQLIVYAGERACKGVEQHDYLNDLFALDVSTWKWKMLSMSGKLPRPRRNHTATFIKKSKYNSNAGLLVWGGFGPDVSKGGYSESFCSNDDSSFFVMESERWMQCVPHDDHNNGHSHDHGSTHGRFQGNPHGSSHRSTKKRSSDHGEPSAIPCARASHTATYIEETMMLYLFGGISHQSTKQDKLNKIYTSRSISYRQESMGEDFDKPQVADFGKDMVCAPNTMHMLNIKSMGWQIIDAHGTPPTPRYAHTAVVSERVPHAIMYFGGRGGGASLPDHDVWVFNTLLHSWSTIYFKNVEPEAIPCPRFEHAAAAYTGSDNKPVMLVFGGSNFQALCAPALHSMSLEGVERPIDWPPGRQKQLEAEKQVKQQRKECYCFHRVPTGKNSKLGLFNRPQTAPSATHSQSSFDVTGGATLMTGGDATKTYTMATHKPLPNNPNSKQRPFSASASVNARSATQKIFGHSDEHGSIMGQLARKPGTMPRRSSSSSPSSPTSPNNSMMNNSMLTNSMGASMGQDMAQHASGSSGYGQGLTSSRSRKKEKFVYTRKGGGVVVRQTIEENEQDPFLIQHKQGQAARREKRRRLQQHMRKKHERQQQQQHQQQQQQQQQQQEQQQQQQQEQQQQQQQRRQLDARLEGTLRPSKAWGSVTEPTGGIQVRGDNKYSCIPAQKMRAMTLKQKRFMSNDSPTFVPSRSDRSFAAWTNNSPSLLSDLSINGDSFRDVPLAGGAWRTPTNAAE
jgi:hypothetical protein